MNNLNIFSETRNELLEHIKKVIDCAIKNNIKVLVFGCPRNRKVLDCTLNNDELFCNFFKPTIFL